MDKKTGRIYTPTEAEKLPPKTLKDLEPLTRPEAAFLGDIDPGKRVAALEEYRAKAALVAAMAAR